MSDERDNVIPVDFAQTPSETVLRPSQRMRIGWHPIPTTCGHQQVEVDEDTLDLSCQGCGAAIDARVFVRELARQERRLQYSRDAAATLRKEVEDLQRQVRNLKAQKRRMER